MEWLWVVLLAIVVFFMYVWFRPVSSPPAPSCSACPNRKNVPSVE